MELKPLKGMKDYYPGEMIVRKKILNKIKRIFELFGFRPLETPALESWKVLSAKGAGGLEILKESYEFVDRGGKKVGLRYDLTVPLARFVANNPNLPLPFKRYQIQKVWRYGDVKRGRLREFYQCDIDIVGSGSVLADEECVACAIFCLKELGFEDFVVRVNNRKVLTALVKYAGVPQSKIIQVLRAIDKMDKIGLNGVKKELEKIKLEKDVIEKIIKFINFSGDKLNKIKEILDEEGKEGINELLKFLEFAEIFGIKDKIVVDLSLARGLDYYTSLIFEIWSKDKKIGSLGGGGRYDNLIEIFSGKKIPATGISLGIERIFELIKMKQKIEEKTPSKVFIATVSNEFLKNVVEITNLLRNNGISCEFDVMGRSLSKQLKYVDKLNIPFTLIIGKKEIENNSVKIRDMKSGKEYLVKISEVVNWLKPRF